MVVRMTENKDEVTESVEETEEVKANVNPGTGTRIGED